MKYAIVLLCFLFGGHRFKISGYLNADEYSWLDGRIGDYSECQCGTWKFKRYGSTVQQNLEKEALEIAKGKVGRPDPKLRSK